jgi:hypothetical protein
MDAQHLMERGETVQGGGLAIPTRQTPAVSIVPKTRPVEGKKEWWRPKPPTCCVLRLHSDLNKFICSFLNFISRAPVARAAAATHPIQISRANKMALERSSISCRLRRTCIRAAAVQNMPYPVTEICIRTAAFAFPQFPIGGGRDHNGR